MAAGYRGKVAMSQGAFYTPYIPNMQQRKYQFSRAKWYTADLWNSDHTMSDVRAWCVEQFGPQNSNPDAWSRWVNHMNGTFRFRDEADYVLFVLKWV